METMVANNAAAERSHVTAAPSGAVRVLLADGHAPFRQGVRLALEQHGYYVCAEAEDRESAVEAAVREQPDLCLIEVRLTGSGITAANRISDTVPGTLVVMLTTSQEDDDFIASLRAGAAGYLIKDIDAERLPTALEAVLRGEAAIPRFLAMRLIDELRRRDGRRRVALERRPGINLREREWEVLELLADGKSTSEIAQLMDIEPATVRSHVSRILQALGVDTRDEAIGLLRSLP
jgi:DNA-binding NarL/FixJ family response regulator